MSGRIAIAGAGFSGAVIARQLADAGWQVDVFDPRPHVAGNCHTERHADTGVLVHTYGPHIFHTANEAVWAYVQRFGEFRDYRHRLRATVRDQVYGLPINLTTINAFFGRDFTSDEAEAYVRTLGEGGAAEPANFEEQGRRMVGRALYEAFFHGYTRKQWGLEPRLLPASILKRLPLRFNRDDTYFNHPYQAIPVGGYTAVITAILASPNITLHLGQALQRAEISDYAHTFYTGPLDGYFDFELGRLTYRTLDFKHTQQAGDFQGCAVMNYCDEAVPHTRITEHKHFAPWEVHARTIYTHELSRAAEVGDTPYYPVRLAGSDPLLEAYLDRARQETGVTFVGRLGTYRYLDMDVCIAEALHCAGAFLECHRHGQAMPAFAQPPQPHG